MVEIIDEGKVKDAVDAISLEKLDIIQDQMKKYICQV